MTIPVQCWHNVIGSKNNEKLKNSIKLQVLNFCYMKYGAPDPEFHICRGSMFYGTLALVTVFVQIQICCTLQSIEFGKKLFMRFRFICIIA